MSHQGSVPDFVCPAGVVSAHTQVTHDLRALPVAHACSIILCTLMTLVPILTLSYARVQYALTCHLPQARHVHALS